MVFGVRRCRDSDGCAKRLTAGLFIARTTAVSADKIPENAGDFRLLDRKVVDVIRALPERNRFMKGLFAWVGFRQAAVDYARAERETGTTKFNYWKLWTLALDGITSASTVPLRIWTYVGGVVALFALGYAVFIVVRTLVFGIEVPGLRLDHGRGAVPRRGAAALARRPRRISRPHPHRDQAAAALCGARDGGD